ncbi:Maf1 regulator-domain-containing protein [Pisolithus orientalis]|uniref:Maf1 regulator-domain-containing protein n=1 Tax=Pisolithus orientalis TaxID=936130 RepID=UPI002224423F|nr:Maf1 regulator-domain-containing protein [Pisolithus orientalis]KAI5995807.1 Maf1 regulator-domain-containing protein [Pisolithus orientalis]
MKYIEFPQLSRLAQALTHEGPECSVHTRIEAYSCKNIKRDKKLFKSLEHAYTDEVACSPPLPSWLEREPEETPFGPMDKAASRKTLYLLIATLNIAFPDHEFSDVKPSHFNKEKSGASVLNALSTTLLSPHAHARTGSMPAPRTYSSYPPISPNAFPSSVPTASSTSPRSQIIRSPYAPPPIVSGTHPTLYRTLDDVIGLGDCQVFSYTPDPDSDPHANDYSDDEDDVVSVADEYSSDDPDFDDGDATFEFDADDRDLVAPSNSLSSRRNSRLTSSSLAMSMPKSNSPDTSPDTRPYTYSPPFHRRVRLKRRVGALLWSSHWFFLNPKLKRILFISVWAHTKRGWEDEADEGLIGESDASYTRHGGYGGERFFGWEGGVGAGARALGLSALV